MTCPAWFRRGLYYAPILLLSITLGACNSGGNGSDDNSDGGDSSGGDSGSGSGSSDTSWNSWVQALSDDGYTVTAGAARIQTSADCDQFVDMFGSCWGNNPAAPYVLIEPPSDGTYVNPTYAEPFSETTDDGTAVNLFWRLAPTDALVTVIDLPPQAAYFGYQSYLFTREASAYDSLVETNTSPDDARLELFASVGNAINQAVIKQASGLDFGGGTIAIISTGNQTLVEKLQDEAKATDGLDSTQLFVEPLGNNLSIGTGESADDLLTLIRYALPEDDSAADDWRDAIASHVHVYRVSASNSDVARYAQPTLTEKNGTDESGYADALDELQRLVQLGLSSRQDVATASEFVTSTFTVGDDSYGLVGPDCIDNGADCLGDTQDTDAYRIASVGKLSGSQIAVSIGVNATQTGNATYVSLGAYDSDTMTGVASASQTNEAAAGFSSGELNGSAEELLTDLGVIDQASDDLKAKLDDLYAVAWSRDCDQGVSPCETISTDDIPEDTSIALAQRAYLRPGDTVGADPDKLLAPRLISADDAQ